MKNNAVLCKKQYFKTNKKPNFTAPADTTCIILIVKNKVKTELFFRREMQKWFFFNKSR
jgi:hypothetical protein